MAVVRPGRSLRTVRRSVLLLLVVALAVVAAGACGGGSGEGASDGADDVRAPSVPEGFEVTTLIDGLERPTQAGLLDDGRLVVAQLAGPEGSPTGQVVVVDPADEGLPEVLVDGLVTPTGVAVVGDELWIMERRRLTRGPLTGGERQVVADQLPFNGRSEGTLTALDDGRLLYNTSGDLEGTEAADGSGVLWSLDTTASTVGAPGAAPASASRVATGFKHAYGRTIDPDGTIWQTEVAEQVPDGGASPDELVAVATGTDGGWPRCAGDRRPVEGLGTSADCETTARPHALFLDGATPTSVVIAPWDPDLLLVALWNEGEVVSVPRLGGDGPVEATPFLTGIEHPQHLLVDGRRVLLTDHTGGRVLAIAPVGAG